MMKLHYLSLRKICSADDGDLSMSSLCLMNAVPGPQEVTSMSRRQR